MTHETIKVTVEDAVCTIALDRPQADNAINRTLIEECAQVLDRIGRDASGDGGSSGVRVVVLQGLPGYFCIGADLADVQAPPEGADDVIEKLYDLWLQLAEGPFISVADVCGRVNAGGLGFVAACDVVLADESATFGLSELLFGLYPACVLPFLIRRVGFQRAHYMTLTSKPISARSAEAWGLVDVCEEDRAPLLGRHLSRMRIVPAAAVGRYKRYMSELHGLSRARAGAVSANREMFADPHNLRRIRDYAESGKLPWE